MSTRPPILETRSISELERLLPADCMSMLQGAEAVSGPALVAYAIAGINPSLLDRPKIRVLVATGSHPLPDQLAQWYQAAAPLMGYTGELSVRTFPANGLDPATIKKAVAARDLPDLVLCIGMGPPQSGEDAARLGWIGCLLEHGVSVAGTGVSRLGCDHICQLLERMGQGVGQLHTMELWHDVLGRRTPVEQELWSVSGQVGAPSESDRIIEALEDAAEHHEALALGEAHALCGQVRKQPGIPEALAYGSFNNAMLVPSGQLVRLQQTESFGIINVEVVPTGTACKPTASVAAALSSMRPSQVARLVDDAFLGMDLDPLDEDGGEAEFEAEVTAAVAALAREGLAFDAGPHQAATIH